MTKAKTKAKKPAAKKSVKPAGGVRKVGVIDTIVKTMSRANGATVAEIVEALKKKFPERDENGMTTTAKIQTSKRSTRREKDEKRGMVYFYEVPAEAEKAAA
jgi:hypothetical protein